MLGWKQFLGPLRALLVACLVLLLSSASLVQLSARSSNGSVHSCGRSQAKCCCRKNAKAPAGPTVTATSCDTGCCQVTLGGIAASGFVQPFSRILAPPSGFLIGVPAGQPAPTFHLREHSLLQRPPPAFPLA